MPLIARASKTVRNKHLIVLVACALLAVWFGYDGSTGWPAKNDGVVRRYHGQLKPSDDPEFYALLERWVQDKGWNQVSPARRQEMSDKLKSTNRTEGWHTPMDILVQYVLTVGLGLTVLGYGAWFFFRCQRRRAIADETGLSPAPRVFVPWGDITKVDNTRWKKTGIVTITYRTPAGETQTAELDDYLLDDLPPVLNELATRAEKAEFINPEGDASQTPSPPA